MLFPRRVLCAAFCAALPLSSMLLVGCSDDGTVYEGSPSNLATGNWQIGSSATAAARLATLSGQLTNKQGVISGVFHAQAASSCVAPSTAFTLTGGADEKHVVTLSGPVAGGKLTLTGTLAEDGRSLTNASYTVSGGSCGLSTAVQATAQAFNPVTGNYAGTFADTSGQVAQVVANFSQSTTPDANGNFTLAGTATVAGDPCFPAAVPVSNTQVTGGTFTFTYSANGASVTANGTFSPDANTLSVTSWTSAGSCGADQGVASSMSRQQAI